MKHFKSNNIYQNVRSNKPPKGLFDLSHKVKATYEIGRLYPFYVQECVPGDSFTINAEVMTRMAPMTAPVMHDMKAYMHFFKVPMRLVYENWGKWITGRHNGTDFNEELPYFNLSNAGSTDITYTGKRSILHHLGMPPIDTDTYGTDNYINAMPLRAFNLIWNEYYRDVDLQLEETVNKTGGEVGGDELGQLLRPKYRCWEKDRFTSARPFPQAGDDVLIPLLGSAPVTGTASGPVALEGIRRATGQSLPLFMQTVETDINGDQLVARLDANTATTAEVYGDTNLNVTGNADLSQAIGGTISDLREGFAIQRFFERLARSGSRYIEYIAAFFGVKSSDARLQRPEYLGGGASNMMFSEVLQTSRSENGETPQGTMAGHGIQVGATNMVNTFCEEHCYIIGVISYLPRTEYYQGIPKFLSRRDRFEFYNPSFAHLGEEPVLVKELYFDPTDDGTNNDDVFGYQSRYSDYRSAQSRTVGEFTDTLKFWHMNRDFDSKPELNSDFVECNADEEGLKRIFAVQTEDDHLWSMIHVNVIAKRPMPFDAEPGFIDHY